MKKEELLEIGLTEEQADKVFAMNGRDVEKHKKAAETAKTDLEAAQKQLADREKDLNDLKQTAGDAEAVKKQLADLQNKYETEAQQHQAAMAERDYADAVNIAVSDLRFSSKAAKSAFVADLKAKKLEIKDGKLDGFDKYLKEAQEADPEAFAPDKPAPTFTRPTGGGTEKPKTAGEKMAESIGKASAQQTKAANDIISMYTGGNK